MKEVPFVWVKERRKMNKRQNRIKELSKYISLSILSMLGLSFYILADTYFIANGIGNDGLTALNIVIPVYSLINATGLMLGMGGATKYSIESYRGDVTSRNKLFSSILSFGIIIGLSFTILGILFAKPILTLLGTDSTIMTYAIDYYITILSFSIPFILNTIVVCFVRNDKNPKLAMIAMITGSLSNVVLDYLFIYPLKMGMFGAALATGFAPIISMLILTRHFRVKDKGYELNVPNPKTITFSLKNLLDGIKLGLPSFINELSTAIIMIIFNIKLLQLVGNVGVAAYGIIANIALVGISVFTGIGQGIQPILSKSYGSNDKKYVKTTYITGLLLSLIVGVIIYVAVLLYKLPLAHMFADENKELIHITTEGMILYFSSFLVLGLNITTTTYFQATNNSTSSFFISICRGLLFVTPTVLLLSNLFDVTGVWLTPVVSEVLTFVLAVVLLFISKGKSMKE